jgi:guanylate kinase
MSKGRIIVLSSPSGCGKSTVANRLLEEIPTLRRSISYTTRDPRTGEKDGKDYHFVSQAEFEEMVKAGKFLEWEKVYGNFYGTSLEQIQDYVNKGLDVLLVIDVKGGKNIKSRIPEGILIFLEPPSVEELERRLRSRRTDSDEEIKKRLNEVKKELEFRRFYDYIVVNDRLEEAVQNIRRIVQGEKTT